MGLADVVDGHTPRRITVALCPDNELADAFQQAQRDLEQTTKVSQSLDSGPAAKARERLDQLRDQVADVSVEFTLQSIGRNAWVKLRDRHQPSKTQREQYRQMGQILDHNPDTFPPAAIAASLVEPVGSSDAETASLVARIWDEWNFGECERLWRACLEANMGAMSVPKRLTASVTTLDTARKSERPTSSDGPEASSTDGGSLAG